MKSSMFKYLCLPILAVTLGCASTKGKAENPVFDMKDYPITHIGVVVKDIEATTKRLSKIFGVKEWTHLNLGPDQFDKIIIDGKEMGQDTKVHLKIANGDVMGLAFEVIEPVNPVGTHWTYLQKYGEGIHHISIPALEPSKHDKIVKDFGNAGSGIDMQGELGKATTFTYIDTQEDLGLLFEIYKTDPDKTSTVKVSHKTKLEGESVIDGANRRIVQIGMVVPDVDKAVAHYKRLLGIDSWQISEVPVSQPVILKGKEIPNTNIKVKVALATHQGMGLELVQPISGPSSHKEHLDKNGPSLHHLAFIGEKVNDPETHDHDKTKLREAGFGIEMQGILFNNTNMFSYLTDGEHSGGLIWEMGKDYSPK